MSPVVTFDLFSALIDSRTGGSAAFERLARTRGWPLSGAVLYDVWDVRNKQVQRRCRDWVPYLDLARAALAETFAHLGLAGDAEDDVATLLGSLPDWPLWQDVTHVLPVLARQYRIGLLSNVDVLLLNRTRAASLVDPALALTSERLQAYKPDPRFYQRARTALGPMVHVASSVRDVRGALEAGTPVVRLRREGHGLDPDGPAPQHDVAHARYLPAAVADALASA